MAEESNPHSRALNTWHIVLIFAAVAVSIYLEHRYAAPFRWFAELQLHFFGAYDSTITTLLTVGFIAGPVFALSYLFRRLGARAPTPGQSAAASRIPSLLSRHALGASLLALALFLLTLSAWYYSDTRHQSLTRVLADVFERNDPPNSKWVSIQGISLFDSAIEFQKSGSVTHYVPLVSLEWKERDPVAIVIAARESELTDSLRRGRWDWYDGMYSDSLLPGVIENELSLKGCKLKPRYFVLDLHASPTSTRRVARDLALFGGVILIGGLAAITITHRRETLRQRIAPLVSGQRDPRFTIKTHAASDSATSRRPSAE